jgi:glutathione S-transferase
MHAARTLVALHVSPWSERAKWALDHHGLAYTVVEHLPVLGERKLRRLVGPTKPKATAPVLIAGEEVFSESWDIAKYADREGSGAKLIPPQHETTIAQWVALADGAGVAGRSLVIASMLASPRALDENGPPAVPAWLRPLLRPVARQAMQAFARKYELNLDDSEAPTRTVRAAMDALRKGLAVSAPYLLGAFGYADIALASIIQGFSPVADSFLKLGPATRAAWTRPDLATDYADLVAWRDLVYARQRHAGGAS